MAKGLKMTRSTSVRAHRRVSPKGRPHGVRQHPRKIKPTPRKKVILHQPVGGHTFTRDYLKEAEGGPGTKTAVYFLNRIPGVYAKTDYSSLVGHSRLVVQMEGKAMLPALRQLKDIGYINSITEAKRSIKEQENWFRTPRR